MSKPANSLPVQFQAVVWKVQTLVDGGLRLTLDLPEYAIQQAAVLMECKRKEIPLLIVVKTDTN